MFHLIGMIIRRVIAHAFVDLLKVCTAWFGKRYASWMFVILLLFIGLSVVNDRLPQWIRDLGVFAGLLLPAVLAVITVAVFALILDLRAIEPARSFEILKWELDEMMPFPTDDHPIEESDQQLPSQNPDNPYSYQPDQNNNDQSLASDQGV